MTDQEIIRGCLRKDESFERKLVQRYSGLLMAVAQRYTRDKSQAMDVTQDAFIKIFVALSKFTYSPDTFKAWMKKIVITTALRTIAKNWNKEEYLVSTHEGTLSSPPEIYENLDKEDLIKVINTLPEGYLQVFNMYVIDGYSHAEIGKTLGIEESTSRSKLTRAKQFLRIKIELFQKIEL